MNCVLLLLFNLVMTILACLGVTLVVGKGSMEFAGITFTFSGTAVFVTALWVAFAFLC